jgi:protein TonB
MFHARSRPVIFLSFVAALGVHLFLLFGLHIGSVAMPLAVGDARESVEVELVEAAAAPIVAAEPEAASTPEPMPAVEPVAPLAPPVEEAMTKPAATPDAPVPRPAATPAPKRQTATSQAPRKNSPLKKSAAVGASAADASSGTAHGGTATKPSYRYNPRPEYPASARSQHQQGTVLLDVEVNAQGGAATVRLEQSSGFPLLDQAAISAVRRWEFEPARIGGIPVASQTRIPVRFSLAGN